MAVRTFVEIEELIAGMVLEQAVEDKAGHSLIERGTVLDDFHIDYLQGSGVSGVYVRGKEAAPEPTVEELVDSLTDAAQEEIDKNRVPDRASLVLSEAVKKRIYEGIEYIYHNTDSEDFESAAHSVTEDLLGAISANNAVALDLDQIKICDEYTFKHSVDVAAMAMTIGKNYGLTHRELREIGLSGLLHDLGKTKVPEEVLNKPERLTPEEFEVMKQHSLFGYQILKEKATFSEGVLMGVLEHHEKSNGNGYPLKMSGDQIHKYAKIISVADVFDALVTARPYKDAFPKREAIEMIMSMTQEMDITAMKSFLDILILYPVDSVVHLSNGEYARVVQNVAGYVLRPRVVGLTSGRLYDLSEDINCASLIIDN